jgi:hypothetical protein
MIKLDGEWGAGGGGGGGGGNVHGGIELSQL